MYGDLDGVLTAPGGRRSKSTESGERVRRKMTTVERSSSAVANGPGAAPRKPLTSAQVQQSFRDRQKAKLENQETQIRQLQGALRQMELDRARQQAELNTLSQFWTGNPAAADMVPASVTGGAHGAGGNGGGLDGALEARVQELERRLAESESARQRTEAQHARNAQELQARLRAVVFERQTWELRRAKEAAHLHEYYTQTQQQLLGPVDHRAHAVFDLDDEGAQLVAKLLRAVRGPDAVGTTTAECRRITPALLHDIWHEAAQRFAEMLEDGAETPGSPAAAMLEHQMHKYHDVLFYMWNRQFPLFQIYNAMMLKGTDSDGQLSPELADRVLLGMQLDDDQMARVCAENEAMIERLNGIYARQQATLRALVEPQSVEMMTAHMADLQASGNEAQLVIRDYHLLVKQAIIRPIQLARGMVAAYPCVLNTLAIGAVLGRRMGKANDRQDRGMAAVLSWLYSDGSSSVMGRPEGAAPAFDAMSIGSLQDALQAVDDISLDLLPADLDLGDVDAACDALIGSDDSATNTGGPQPERLTKPVADPLMQAAQEVLEERA